MKRNYSLFRIALVLATGCAFFLPVSAPAPTVHIKIPQFYLGFSQSIENPDARGPAALNIPSQTPDGDFQGFITILGSTYTIRGKVDDDGNLEFNSGHAGPIKGKGKWQDLTRGGALLLSDSATRREDFFLWRLFAISGNVGVGSNERLGADRR